MECLLFLFFVLFGAGCVTAEISLRFVFIIEHHQPELSGVISRALLALEQDASDVKIDGDVVTLDREHEDESYRMLCSSASKGVSAVIDLSWSPWGRSARVAAAAGAGVVNLRMGVQHLVSAAGVYLDARNASDAAVLVDTEAEVDQVLYQLLGSTSVRVWVQAGVSREGAKALSRLRPPPAYYVLLGDPAFVKEAYTRAVKEQLVRHANRWTLVFTEPPPALDYLQQPAVTLTAEEPCCRMMGAAEPCDCPLNQRPLTLLLSSLRLLASLYSRVEAVPPARVRCEELSPASNGSWGTVEELLRQLGNDSMFHWDPDSSTLSPLSRYTLSSVQGGGEEVFASWLQGEEFRVLEGRKMPTVRQFYRVGTAEAVPWTMRVSDPSGDPVLDEQGRMQYEGYCIDLIAALAQTMDFDYELVVPSRGSFGERRPNGTWDGVVGDLITGETDMAVGALTMTAEREEVIDFVPPYFEQTGILIVIRKPSRKTSLFKFMTVLRGEVWASVVCALAATGVLLWILDKYSPYSGRNNPQAYPYPCREFTLKESFWFALTSFTPQGGGEAPKALSGRALVAAYWLFVVLMLATFTANLAAFLTVERMQSPVSSLEQLARQSRINYTVVAGSSTHHYFINMKFAEDTLYRVWKEITLNATSDQAQYRVWDYPIREQYGHILLAINASGPVADARAGFRAVNEHTDADFAFIHDSAEIRFEVGRDCNLSVVGSVFAERPYALAVAQGSRLQEQLSRALLHLQKDRVLDRLSQKYWNESSRQSCPDADESEGITLESLGGVFIATLFGLGLAMLTLAWEVFYYKRKEKKKLEPVVDKPQAFTKTKMAAKPKRKGGKGKKVTIGDTFKPVDNVSFISVYPKREYHP